MGRFINKFVTNEKEEKMKQFDESLVKRVNKEGAKYFNKWRKVVANTYMLGLINRMPSDTEILSEVLKQTYEVLSKQAAKTNTPFSFAFPASETDGEKDNENIREH